MPLTDDYLQLEGLLIDRLRAETDCPHILAATDLAGVGEESQLTPAIHVLYDGDDLGDEAGRGAAQVARQRWLAVVAVRNRRGGRSGSGAREEAGHYIPQLIAALQGWRPASDTGELVRAPAPKPAYSDAGFAYFPFLFRATVPTLGTLEDR